MNSKGSWRWQSIDGAMNKAPLAQETIERNPTDQEKRNEAQSFGQREWYPVIDHRLRGSCVSIDAPHSKARGEEKTAIQTGFKAKR